MTKGKRSMKFRAHETFSIRKGWLSKGMKQVVKDPSVFVSKEYNPMDVLGIGSNMVKSLRYWLPAVGLSESPKGKSAQYLTEFGEIVYAQTYSCSAKYCACTISRKISSL